MSTSRVVPRHALINEGAAFHEDGTRADPRLGTSGFGRGRCECGALSEPLPSGAARKRWHREHKTDVLMRRAT